MDLQAPAREGQQVDVSPETGAPSEVPLPPERSTWNILRAVLVTVLSLPIHFYRLCLSPLLPAACRHEPTCSRYALEALQVHGPLRGLRLTIGRLLRCQPWGTFGPDPVPPPPSSSSRRRKPAVTHS